MTPKRESAQREMERRIVAQFLTCMDGMEVLKYLSFFAHIMSRVVLGKD